MSNTILPLTTPQYLTEDIFQSLGFFTGSATHQQIQAAFSIAESQVALTVGTFLSPTTFTGTFAFGGFGPIYEAPVGKIISIDSVVLHMVYANGVERSISGSTWILDPDNGFFQIFQAPNDNSSCMGCVGANLGFYRFSASITAGYPVGSVTTAPTALLASCMAADIALKMMYDEGIGVMYENMTKSLQVGRVIQSFETKDFMNTLFGPSSRANYISRLLEPYKITKAGKLGR